jgi:predicted RNA-binding Zn ribbon-like protein
MDSVALNPGTYGGTYKLIGGEISLDFINTISWPNTSKEHDWLDQPINFLDWAVAAKVIDKHTSNVLKELSQDQLVRQMDQVLLIRNDLQEILRPLAFNKNPTSVAIDKLNLLVHKVSVLRRIDLKSYQWTWTSPTSLIEVAAPLIWDTAHILTSCDHSRIGHCPACNWIFYDATRNHTRKWCDMEDCGSRDKALRYYHRQKGEHSNS